MMRQSRVRTVLIGTGAALALVAGGTAAHAEHAKDDPPAGDQQEAPCPSCEGTGWNPALPKRELGRVRGPTRWFHDKLPAGDSGLHGAISQLQRRRGRNG